MDDIYAGKSIYAYRELLSNHYDNADNKESLANNYFMLLIHPLLKQIIRDITVPEYSPTFIDNERKRADLHEVFDHLNDLLKDIDFLYTKLTSRKVDKEKFASFQETLSGLPGYQQNMFKKIYSFMAIAIEGSSNYLIVSEILQEIREDIKDGKFRNLKEVEALPPDDSRALLSIYEQCRIPKKGSAATLNLNEILRDINRIVPSDLEQIISSPDEWKQSNYKHQSFVRRLADFPEEQQKIFMVIYLSLIT
ncbi:MAG: hypothetical protein GY756_23225 [bacterium]|nr:hypothetical protein [bacterium]